MRQVPLAAYWGMRIFPVHGEPGSPRFAGTQAKRIFGGTPLVEGGPVAQPVIEVAPLPASDTEAVMATSVAASLETVVGERVKASRVGAVSSHVSLTTWKPIPSVTGEGLCRTAWFPALSAARTWFTVHCPQSALAGTTTAPSHVWDSALRRQMKGMSAAPEGLLNEPTTLATPEASSSTSTRRWLCSPPWTVAFVRMTSRIVGGVAS